LVSQIRTFTTPRDRFPGRCDVLSARPIPGPLRLMSPGRTSTSS
jgi:hypothetical protein